MYGLEVWGNTYPTYLNDIFVIQKKMVRIMTFSDYRANSTPLFKKLGILDIFKQHKFQLAVFVHDALNHRLPAIFNDFFLPIQHMYRTRQNLRNNLATPKIRHKAGEFTVKYAATKVWNDIPNNIREISSRYRFKLEYKKYLQNSLTSH